MLNIWSCVFNKFNKQISSDTPNTGIIRIFFKVSICLEYNVTKARIGF